MLAYYNKQCILKLEEISVAHVILFYFLLDALMIYYISLFLGSKWQCIKNLVVVQHDRLVFDELNFQNSLFLANGVCDLICWVLVFVVACYINLSTGSFKVSGFNGYNLPCGQGPLPKAVPVSALTQQSKCIQF